MADGLSLQHSVFLSLFVKSEPCRQRLPAAPSVAAKCPKFISGERRGRRGAKIHQESDTRGGKETGREERGPTEMARVDEAAETGF